MVKRYEPYSVKEGVWMAEEETGTFVHHEDYAALEAKLEDAKTTLTDISSRAGGSSSRLINKAYACLCRIKES